MKSRRLPLLLPIVALLAACSGPDETARYDSAVLITLDTTRVDALGCFGGRPGITPFLDAFAGESVVYDRARSVAPLTLPAHASMLTGLFPPRHTLRDNGLRALPESASTTAERARDAGLATAAFVSAVVLDQAWGLAQGFDVYDQPEGDPDEARVHISERRAPEVADAAIEWLAERGEDERFFLWAHFFDPHSPYDPPAEFKQQAGGDNYLGEVAAMDAAVGRLIDALRTRGSLARTLIVIVADHGESLGQHGEPSHSVFCYEPTIRIPFLVRHGDGWRAGQRVAAPVSLVDVHPTVCEALGLGAPADQDGESLFRRDPSVDRSVYFESYCGFVNFGWSTITGCADRRGKYIHSSEPELYRPDVDPREKKNLVADEPGEVERYRATITALTSKRALPISSDETVEAAVRARIQDLGYAGAGDPDATLPDPLEDTGRPSPRSRVKELRAYYEAIIEANAGGRDAAIVELQAIAASNPQNLAALDILGAYLVEARRYDEAVVVLKRLLSDGADRLTTHVSLGRCYEAQQDLERAVAHYRRGFELHASDARREDLARALDRAGQRAEADALRRGATAN